MILSNFERLRRPVQKHLKLAIITWIFASLSSVALAQSNIKPASVSAEDWQASGQNGIVALRLDGRVINILHEQGNRYLRQGYRAAEDDKRNVEASPSDTPSLPSRTKGFDWVLQSTGDGYFNIINLTTGLYLTLDSDDERNVSNWGQKTKAGRTKNLDATQQIANILGVSVESLELGDWGHATDLTNHQKWRFVLSNTQKNLKAPTIFEPGTYGSFRIYNKQNNQPLTMHSFGLNGSEENVTVWPDPGPQAKGFDWSLVPARDTAAEGKILRGNYKNGATTQFRSTSLASVRRLTIEKVRAIKVSTGQDDATKVLFTAIDLALDAGMGVATGGASAAAKTALKYGARALTKESLQAAAKAGLKAAAKKTTAKQIKADTRNRILVKYGKAAATDIKQDTALEFAKLTSDILDATSSEAVFNKVYGESPDDFYIKVNGSSIFPHGGREHMDISSQDTLIVNKSFVFDRFDGAAIQLMEYDSASDDDSLGEVRWLPYKNAKEGVFLEFGQVSALLNGKGYLSKAELEELPNIEAAGKVVVEGVERYENVLISKDSEGSLYEVTYRVEPFVPAHMILGKLHSKRLAERIKIWKYQEAQNFEAEQRRLAWVAERDAKKEKEELDKLYAVSKAVTHERDLSRAKENYSRCSQRGSYKSYASDAKPPENFTVLNMGSQPIRLYWINNDGRERNYTGQDEPVLTVAGSSAVVENASPNNWYIAVDATGQCVGFANGAEVNKTLYFDAGNVVAGAMPNRPTEYQIKMVNTVGGYVTDFPPVDPNAGVQQPNQPVDQTSNQPPAQTGDQTTDQGGYDDGSGYVDQNEYADDQSGLPQEDPNPYSDDGSDYDHGSGYVDETEYADDSTGYEDGTSAAEGPGCEYLGQVGSQDGGEIVTVTFSNTGTEEMHLYWIDGDGNPTNYSGTDGPEAVIPANSYQGVRTMIGHVFAAANTNGNCLAAMQVEMEGEDFAIASLQ